MSKHIQEAIRRKRRFLIRRLLQLKKGGSAESLEKLTLTELEEMYDFFTEKKNHG